MNFFSAHYEKVILASLLVVFAILLVLQVNFLQDVQNKRVNAILEKQEPATDQIVNDFSSEEYKEQSIFYGDTVWSPSSYRDDKTDAKTDLFACFPLSICPFCRNLINHKYFPAPGSKNAQKCPITDCNHALLGKQKRIEMNVDSEAGGSDSPDKNQNGVPDEWEKQYNVYADSADEIDNDPDGDFFSTREEYEFKTDPNNPTSHPKYIDSIAVRRVIVSEFKNLRFRGVDDYSDPDMKNWKLKLEYQAPDERKPQIKTHQLGDTFKHGKDTFVIAECVPDNKDRPGDKTYIFITREGSDAKIKCERMKKVFDPIENVMLSNAHPKDTFSCKVGEKFTLGNSKNGVENYTLISAKGRTAQIKSDSGEMITLTGKKKTPDVEKRGPLTGDEQVEPEFPDGGLSTIEIPQDQPRRKARKRK